MSHVELTGLSKTFGAFQALQDISLNIEKGEFCALLGPSATRPETTDAQVSARTWHTLRIVAKDNRFNISFDGHELFTATDGTFPDGGKVGLWTKADSVTWFDGIETRSLD